MTEQRYDGGDLSYDEAHDTRVPQRPQPRRTQEHAPPSDPPADLSGDYSYDLAHDVPPG
jgi:hypothetical protein